MIKTPLLTTDGIIELYNQNNDFLGVVFIDRLNPPYGLALPGGFVDVGEKVEDALLREMKEETSLDVEILSLQNIYSNPKRDPRFHTASAVFLCKAKGQPKACDDAKQCYVFELDKIPFEKLVFDHKEIVQDYLKRKELTKN